MEIGLLLQTIRNFGQACAADPNLLSFPTWYKYLHGAPPACEPTITKLTDFWLVLAAILEILFRLGGLVATGFIIWGAIRLIVSQGEPNSVKDARNTIMNALVGLVIMVVSIIGVNVLAGRF